MMSNPIVLIILDGWGCQTHSPNNAISVAKTPTWNKIWEKYPHTTLSASGLDVGLPKNQMGNSEVGHLTMGAGRRILQDLTRISADIENGQFQQNSVLLKALQKIKKPTQSLHILGLLSPGGVHSHEEHIHALVRLAAAQHIPNILIHAFLDGRDTPPKSAKESIKALEKCCHELPQTTQARIASLSGRYYAMDRDNRFDRTKAVYEMLTEGNTTHFSSSALEALIAAYSRDETDEFVKPTLISPVAEIKNDDVVIFMNFRSDRARQLSHAFLNHDFIGFKRSVCPKLADFVTLTEYDPTLQTNVLYPSQPLKNLLGDYLQQHNLRQLRIAETEKYAHVTFFFNGGREQPFKNEDRILVPSKKVATYDLTPEMSAIELTEELVIAIQKKSYDVIICNYANADMVGHTGNFEATVKAIETLDDCLAKVLKTLARVNGQALITADHGNAEMMFEEKTHMPHTAHTINPIPFIYIGQNNSRITTENGTLQDIAPTLLYLLNLPIPAEMTGKSLVKLIE